MSLKSLGHFHAAGEKDKHLYLDLTRFGDRVEALGLAGENCPDGYTSIARDLLEKTGEITVESLVLQSCISRARGLHVGCMKALDDDNPHATIPLLRAYVELTATIFYVNRNQNYYSRLAGIGSESHKGPVKFSQMFEAIIDDLPGMAAIYAELSEFTHFRSLGVYNTLSPGESPRTLSWTDVPRFRSDRDYFVACAQLRELAEATQWGLNQWSSSIVARFFNREGQDEHGVNNNGPE